MYILRCADDSFYVGSTRDLDRRLAQHSTGLGSVYTSTRLPIELVYREEFGNIAEAYAREKQVQGWSRAKREALICGDFSAVSDAAARRQRYVPLSRRGAGLETGAVDGTTSTCG